MGREREGVRGGTIARELVRNQAADTSSSSIQMNTKISFVGVDVISFLLVCLL